MFWRRKSHEDELMEFSKKWLDILKIKGQCNKLGISAQYQTAVEALVGFSGLCFQLLRARNYSQMLDLERQLAQTTGPSVANSMNALQAAGEGRGSDFSNTLRPIFKAMKKLMQSRGLV